MAIIRNHFYNIVFTKEDMINVLMLLDSDQHIYPQEVKELAKYLQKVEPVHMDDPYSAPLDEVEQLIEKLDIKKEKIEFPKEDIDLQSFHEYLKEVDEKVSSLYQVIDDINREKEENREAVTLLKHLQKQDVSLDEIQELKYISLRFGKIPLSQMDKIKYYQNEHFIIRKLSSDDQYLWVVYCALNKEIGEIDNIFSAIDFQEIVIPQFAHGKIEDAVTELKNEHLTMEKYIEDLLLRIDKIKKDNKKQLLSYDNQLLYLKNLFASCKYVASLNDKASVYVFSPYNKMKMTEIFHGEGLTVTEHPVNLYYEKGIMEPVILKNNSFVKPFEKLISFKSGDCFDPTGLIAVIMLLSALLLIGDLGLGVALILLSVIIKGKYAKLLQRVGLFVLIGGLMTATIFYQQPMYHSPLLIPQISTSIAVRFVVFILINLIFYMFMMIIKNISRKKTMSKGGV